MQAQTSVRKYYLDWLRVGVILTVFVYHSTRFFNLGDWHVKNPVTYWNVEIFEQVLAAWMMPFCFFISGAAVFYALGRGGAGKFVKDKAMRLLVPLVVGIFTHSALQIYLERVSHGQFTGSFFEFYPHYFEGAYGIDGNFGWMGVHLWYVELLFVFSLIFLPLFLLVKRGWGKRLLAGVGHLLAIPGAAFLLVIPTILILEVVPSREFLGMDVFGGWGIAAHAWFFLSGFLIASSERVLQSIQRLRWIWLAGAIILTAAQVEYVLGHPGSLKQTPLMAFLWILAFLSLGMRYLDHTNSRIQHANEAVLPFYILHQPVLIVIGYFVEQWTIPDLAKYLIIAGSSLVTTVLSYELLVRRYNLLRMLFGMKSLQRQVAMQPEEIRPVGLPGTLPS